jgi:hypothetical protein
MRRHARGQVWLQSALWIGLALAASIISIRVAISVALIEILVGVVVIGSAVVPTLIAQRWFQPAFAPLDAPVSEAVAPPQEG